MMHVKIENEAKKGLLLVVEKSSPFLKEVLNLN